MNIHWRWGIFTEVASWEIFRIAAPLNDGPNL
jgi:hypothetical protein